MTTPIDPSKGLAPMVDTASSIYKRFLSIGHTAQEAQALTRMLLDAVLSQPLVMAMLSAQMKGRQEEKETS